MRNLTVSLILFALTASIGLGWLFDFAYQYYEQQHTPQHASQQQPLHQILRNVAATLDSDADESMLLQRWPVDSDYRLRLMDTSALSLPKALQAQLQAGELLELVTDEGLSMHLWLRVQNKLLVLDVPMQQSSETEPARYWLTTLFYLLLIALFMLWLSPLLRRLMALQQAAKAFGEGSLHSRVNVAKRSYIKDLELEFNHMAQRIEDLISDVKLLSSAVSHDLRTPLARIRMGLDTLSETDDPVQREQYEVRINQHIDDMVELIEALLRYARLDQAMLDLQKQQVDLMPMLNGLIQSKTLAGTDIHIQSSESTALVLADPTYLKILFNNVLDNALKFGTGRVVIELSRNHDQFAISVSDNGPGIPEAQRQRVLKPFVRGELDQSGFGLGLAMVRRVLDWHQGDIELGNDKELGGAKIVVRLPVAAMTGSVH
ncbi:MAG: ATP-binding protein [Aestuariibacter sp.]